MDKPSRAIIERERKRLMARRSSLMPGRELSEAVATYIERYTPKWPATDLAKWKKKIAKPVRAWVISVGPANIESARTLLHYCGHYTLWHYDTYGAIDAKQLWTQRGIEHWARVVMKAKSDVWQEAAEDRLKAMGPFVNPKGSWAPPPVERSRRPRLAGYSREEEQAYVDAALAYSREPRPRVLFFLAGTFGAGLDGGELLRITANNVEFHGEDVSIVVPEADGATRKVPVRRMYHEMLREVVATSKTKYLIGKVDRRRGIVTNLSMRLRVDGLERLRSFRMRATWLERHIESGTNIALLIELAGRETADSITQAALRVGIIDPAESLVQARLA